MQKIYRDQGISGASSKRPALNELLKECRGGSIDVLVVWKFDRFARSLNALIAGLETCRALGIDFVSVTEAVDTSLPAGEPVFQMIGTEGRELRRLRIQQHVPFRELAERFGVDSPHLVRTSRLTV